MRGRIIAGIAALAFAHQVLPARAEWTMSQRSAFLSECIPACEANPNVHPTRREQCGLFCNCLANEGEKMFSPADYEEMDADARANRDTAKTRQFHAIVPVCNQQAFGQ